MTKSRLVMVCSDKGGVGKSLFSTLLWERYLREGVDAVAFDADGSTGSFAQACAKYTDDGVLISPQPKDGVTLLNLHGTLAERDLVADSLLAAQAAVVLVDLPAVSLTVFKQMQAERNFSRDTEDEGFALVCVTVCTSFRSSLVNLSRSFDLFPRAAHVVVLNEDRGATFFLWHGAEQHGNAPAIAKQRLANFGDRGVGIAFPSVRIDPLVMADLFHLSPGAAAEDRRLSKTYRSCLRDWIVRVDEAMRPADHLLGFTRSER